MKYLLILSVLLLLACTVLSLMKRRSRLLPARLVTGGLAVITALAAGIAENFLLSVAIGITIWTALSFLFSFLAKRTEKEGLSGFLRFISKAILVFLVLEVVVFNFNSFHLMKSGYETTDLDLSSATVDGLAFNGSEYVNTADSAMVEFPVVDKKIGTVFLDVESAEYKVDYSMDFADETNASYYLRSGLVSGSVFRDIEATKTVVCDFSGKVSKLRIYFNNLSGNTVLIRSIRINTDYPSCCSYPRITIFLLCAAFVWIFRRSVKFTRPIGETMYYTKILTAFILILFVLGAMTLSGMNINLSTDFQSTSGNQISKELVDAFEHGHVTLDAQPSQELLLMDNPYDWSARIEQGIDARWDHVYYEGNYYSYYGIGPVILLFLPYHLVTGYYFPSGVAIFLFTSLGLIFVGMTFFALMKKFFREIPLSVYTVSLVIILASTGAYYCTIVANFYEIAQSSGFCFTALGAYFLVTSNAIGDGKIRKVRALFSSLFFAVAVTCRPTTAVWCAAAVAFIIAGVLKLRRANSPKKDFVFYLLCALVPFAAIGGTQMLYNYARFGSFTDFGIAYSLTINDFTHTEFHTQLAAIGFFNYIFAPPSFSGTFPYVQTTLSTLGVNGYYFTATNNGCGLLFRALPLFSMFASPFALKYIKKENRLRTVVLFTVVGILAPFIIIASVWESGYGVRYMMDFAPWMLICAFFVIYVFYRNLKSEESKRIYRTMLLIAMFLSVAVNFALIFSYAYPSSNVSGYEAFFENIKRMFSVFNT